MISKLKNIALALSSVAFVGLSAQSYAAPAPFTVNPNAIPGTTGKAPFVADFIAGTSSELLHVNGNTTSGSGFLVVTGFTLNSNPIFGNVSGLGNTYGEYILFDLVAQGPFAPGSTQTLTTLNYRLFADPNLNTTFNQATVSGNTGTEATLGGTTSDDVLLAFGSLFPGSNSIAGVDAQGGVFVNATQTVNLCSNPGQAKNGNNTFAFAGCTSAVGTNYFIAPVPFFQIAFDEFNNTAQGVTRSTDGTLVAIRSATGGFDFNAVPEPTSLALFGIAAAGLALSRRRKQ